MGARRIDGNSKLMPVKQLMGGYVIRNLFTFVMLGLVFAGVYKMYQPTTLPFSRIQMFGEMQWLNRDRLNTVVVNNIDGGFFSLNVKKLKQQLESLDWVKAVAIRRVWPNILQINVTEQQPVAVWNGAELINVDAEVFSPPGNEFPDGLVKVSGPEGYHRILMEKLMVLRESMMPQGLSIASVVMNNRRAIEVQLQNGVKLLMGRVHNEFDRDQELRRFARVYQTTLSPRAENIDQVDLRYTNGFAVRWKADANVSSRSAKTVSQNTLKKREAREG